ncbi:hypothetical protein [Aureimonas phyllosphaerae]|uniref:Uncharacterized protein n=1 Tax=Aureimonas phyllosphaerae TaxID=1166078 RepID=A0A7W6FUG8_9HYPH|nr:hypothetical protein [Aureimonas phyllosphaerae]MBB3935775.1 hypothetical protein [Aureimonas phyllosphaerae]MBB3959783.1 hypothetical protein [Aureimonas phyllosphaerae]SFF14970.1 hypothetical protein SAMN05216566_103314 [Aureimonas phyllosphaerae]
MLKPLTLVAVLMATTAPLAHAQEMDDYGDRLERVDRGDDRGDLPMRDVRRGDRWAMDREDRADDRGPGDRDRDEDRDRDRKKDDDKDKGRDRDRAEMRDREDRGPRDRDDRGSRMRGPDGPEGRRGPPPPPPPRAGFEISLGGGQTIRVDCGDEPFASCIEAAKPIIDSARDMARGGPAAGGPEAPVTQVPPPPADLVTPPAGETPPPPAQAPVN